MQHEWGARVTCGWGGWRRARQGSAAVLEQGKGREAEGRGGRRLVVRRGVVVVVVVVGLCEWEALASTSPLQNQPLGVVGDGKATLATGPRPPATPRTAAYMQRHAALRTGWWGGERAARHKSKGKRLENLQWLGEGGMGEGKRGRQLSPLHFRTAPPPTTPPTLTPLHTPLQTDAAAMMPSCATTRR